MQIDRNTGKQWTILAIKRLQSWMLSSYLPPYIRRANLKFWAMKWQIKRQWKTNEICFAQKIPTQYPKSFRFKSWTRHYERANFRDDFFFFYKRKNLIQNINDLLDLHAELIILLTRKLLCLRFKNINKNKKEVMHNIKWNDFCLSQLLSIVGAHRQYSRMFHWLGRFQNHLSDNSNLSIFCALTRHCFFLSFYI